ncbi:hypothetical protein A8L44_05795 [Bacillus sp. FJAT-27986]|nr:hypothetical protein A8L44_05795 [Bacillus sp. FJAT-27986]
MILFTSDLDRTLIYSKNMMDKYPIDNQITPVEFKDDQVITYMSQTSIDLLQQFNQQHLFVPVTTRALYQYERIEVFQQKIKPKYAIVSNGGTILVDGKSDSEWDDFIKNHLSVTSLPHHDMLNTFAKIRHDSWVEREFYIDSLFYMYHVNKDTLPHQELLSFEDELNKIGWRTFLHGRKLYILPSNLNKVFAVEHLKKRLDYDIHTAAGDSLMDYDMIAIADKGYSLKHGELYDVKPNDPKINWLKGKGAASTEDLIKNLLSL